MSGKLGPVLWQFPATFHRDDERLASAACGAASGTACVRVPARELVCGGRLRAAAGHAVALVIADHGSRPLPAPPSTASWDYIGSTSGIEAGDGNYSRSEILDGRSASITERRTWVYFNNDWEAFAPANARELLER